MKTPPHRIALVALILLVLAGLALWWWAHPAVQDTTSHETPARASPSDLPMAMPQRVSGSLPGTWAGNACSIAMHGAFNARARTLALRDDANSQLAYAMAMPFDAPAYVDGMGKVAVQHLLERREQNMQRALLHAAKLAPTRPDVLFLASAQCGSGKTCRGVQQALLAADADNLAVWFQEMGRPSVQDDPKAYEHAFGQAAKATRNDSYADSALQVRVETYGDMPMPAACSSEQAKAAMRRKTGMDHDFSMLDQALVLASASRAMPAYTGIRVRCMPKPGRAMGAATQAGCRNILTRMADGDTLIDRAIGLATMVQLVADGPDASAWRQRYRDFRWMYAQHGGSDIYRSLQPEDYWLDEIRTMQAALEASGRWPPPADWLPDDETSRSLVQTGRPPLPKAR